MAVTSKKNKARLDFAEAIEEAVPEIKKEDIDMAANNAVNSNESNQVDTKPVEINVENQAKNEVIEDTQTVVDNTESTPVENNVVEAVVIDKETGEIIESDLDALLSSMSQASGKQKSVYLEYDNYTYIQEKCKKTNAKFSTVLNVLLRKAIQNQ